MKPKQGFILQKKYRLNLWMLVNHNQCFTAVKYNYGNQSGSKKGFI